MNSDSVLDLTNSIQMNLAQILSAGEPNEALFVFMYENRTYVELKGETLDEIVKQADAIARSEQGKFGTLCPVILSSNGLEIRRTGTPAHVGDNTSSMGKWVLSREQWRIDVENDPIILKIIALQSKRI